MLAIAEIIVCTAYSPCINGTARNTVLFVTVCAELLQHQKLDKEAVVLRLTAMILEDRKPSFLLILLTPLSKMLPFPEHAVAELLIVALVEYSHLGRQSAFGITV